MSEVRRRIVLLPAAIAVASLAAGCVSESYHARDVARYRKVLDGPNAPTTRPLYDPGAPLSLVDALAIANRDNESIASSGESYVQALAEKMRAAGTFLPTLSLSPSYTISRTKSSSSNVPTGVITPGTGTGTGTGTGGTTGGEVVQINTPGRTTERTSVTAGANYSIAPGDFSTLEAANLSVEQRRLLLLDERETILVNVVSAYYTVLRAERQTEVYENSVNLRNEQVRDQEARLKLGSVRPLDLAQSQAELASIRAQLTQSKTDAANARSALARLMGVDAVDGKLTDLFQLPGPLSPADEWATIALAERQDLRAADRSVEIARANVETAIRQYFPSVSINFNYFLYNNPSSTSLWSSAISANVPIFSGLQIEADVRRAWSSYRQAGLSQQQSRRLVLDDVKQNYRNVANSRDRIVDLEVQVEAAQRSVDLSARAYQLGSISNLDRLSAQDSLLSAQLNLVYEQFNEKRYFLTLLRSTGRLATVLPTMQ